MILCCSAAYSLYSDCKELQRITNGAVSITGLTYGSVATYSCIPGYALVGEQNRTCTAAGMWSKAEPRCGMLYA